MEFLDPDWSVLDDIAPDLRKYLNIPNIRPILRAQHLLTADEFEQVEISSANPTSQAIDKFVSIMKTKCPDHAEMLLEVLKLSLQEEDYHFGHIYLSTRLEDAIRERKSFARDRKSCEGERSLNESALRAAVENALPAHSLARQNDSGLGLAVVPDSSAGSSQDTGSPRSTYSGSSIASGPHRQPVRRLKVPGLDKMESGSVSCHTLDERQVCRLRHKIIQDTNSITSRFALMVLGVYRLLKQNHTPVDEVRIMLQFLGCKTSNSSTTNDSITMFSGSDEISESKDVTQLIECLRKYSSWYNYRLMKEVAEQFAGREGKKLISDYEADLRKHYVSLIAYQCPDFVLEQKVPVGYTQLIVKVDWDYMSTNLQDIVTFQANLAEILELEPYVFQLRSVEEGCVRLEWGMPAALESHVTEIMVEREESLRKLKVLRLEVVPALSPLAPAKIFIGKHSPKANGSMLNPAFPSHISCGPTLSGSSSIISVLDQPISSVEAELLSLYDSDSSRGGSMHEEGDLPIFNYPECVPHVDDASRSDMSYGSSEGFGGADVGFVSDGNMDHTDFNNMTTALNSSSPGIGQAQTSISPHPARPYAITMRRVYCSEGNLSLALYPQTNLHTTKREGRSLPHIADGGTSDSGENRMKPCYHNRLKQSLVKLRQSFLGRLRHSNRKMKMEENEATTYCPSPSPLLHPMPITLLYFTEEPRRIGNSRDRQCNSLEQNLQHLQLDVESETSVKGEFIDQSPLLDVHRYTSSSSATSLQLPGQRRDSATPSSPGSSSMSLPDASSPVVPRVKRDQGEDRPRVDRDSGCRSESSQPAAGLYHRQISFDSVETESLASVSTQPSSKRNSYSSHYYVNINPIMEDPDAPQIERHWEPRNSIPQYPPSTTRVSDEGYPLENVGSRERSRSLNEGYARSTRLHSSTASPQSSGYVSYAGSMYQMDADTIHSDDCLTGGACSCQASPSPHPFGHHAQNPAPFQSAPMYPGSQVRRGGSLKASVKFSTDVTKAQLLKSSNRRSLTD